jgi:exosortase A-associated hydrolase 2
MSAASAAAPAEAFFLDASPGRRFCLYVPPATPCRGSILYVHPFAEELNRARRMAAMQARAFAARGYGVLLLDLHGCGDSSGDFGDARWDTWKADLALGAAWLRRRLDAPLTLWGLRLGALLALDAARSLDSPVHQFLLWQPVQQGSSYLTQFLRLRTAGAMMDGDIVPSGTDTLRKLLAAGEMVEVAGYDLAPGLAAAIDRLAPLDAWMPGCPVHWFEATRTVDHVLPAGAARVSAAWRGCGVDVRVHALPCPTFWITPEVDASIEWLAATTSQVGAAEEASVH